MAWVLRTERHYLDGKTAVFYHKGFPFGIMNESTLSTEDARQFRTKKEAMEYRKEYGMRQYEPLKVS